MENDQTSRAVLAGASVGNMTYHGGPVQHTQKVFTIFWNPTVTAFPAGYQTTINQFVQDLNRTSYYAIASQYGDGAGTISTVVSLGGTWLDTVNPLPRTALTFSDLANEVSRAIAAKGWTSDANSYFQIYTPSGISNGDASNICGLHYGSNPAFGQILFPQPGCFESSPWPNGQTVDAAINTSAHEIMETVTDPLGDAWYFMNGSGEIGDLCNFMFGGRATDGSNVNLNGHKYIVQQQWSNAISGCALSYSDVPMATTLLSPSGRIRTNTPTFTWNTIGSATMYYLLVQNFSGTAVVQQWYASAACGASTCSVTPAVVLSRGAYTWWVGTWNSSGYGPLSSSLAFFRGSSAPGDFDGDAKADVTVYFPSAAQWWILYSRTNFTTNSGGVSWGGSGAVPVPGDYDGDGKIDPAVYFPATGQWWILYSSTGYTTNSGGVSWGGGSAIPVPGDYDGDGKTDPAVYFPGTGQWWILYSSTSYRTNSGGVSWGSGVAVPVPGDYDGDGKTDPAVYFPSLGQWWILYSSTHYTTNSGGVSWGGSGATPAPGDYDGDGKTDPAVFMPSTGQWWILYSSTGYTTNSGGVSWGGSGATAVPGDYDGDGKTDPAVYFPATGQWWILYSGTHYATNSGGVPWGGGSATPINEAP
jgi:hypothetical protein